MEHGRRLNVIGPKVRAVRESLDLSQEELAAKCQVAGLDITRGTLAKIEACVRSVADFEVHALARMLKVPVDTLFPTRLTVLLRKARNPKGSRRKKGAEK
jgi:transcriptional regulator with XRE-family HTH domain